MESEFDCDSYVASAAADFFTLITNYSCCLFVYFSLGQLLVYLIPRTYHCTMHWGMHIVFARVENHGSSFSRLFLQQGSLVSYSGRMGARLSFANWQSCSIGGRIFVSLGKMTTEGRESHTSYCSLNMRRIQRIMLLRRQRTCYYELHRREDVSSLPSKVGM